MFVVVSIWVTVPSPELVTYTVRPLGATTRLVGSSPTRIGAAAFRVRRSTGVTEWSLSVYRVLPSGVTTTAPTTAPVRIGRPTTPVLRFTGVIDLSTARARAGATYAVPPSGLIASAADP